MPSGARRRGGSYRKQVEHLVRAVLKGSAIGPGTRGREQELAREVSGFDTSKTRVVVLGGGTGLSTVVGGNSQAIAWPDRPFGGLKEEFPRLDVVVVTTDDGGSTGRLLKCLPMIGIGDLRKSCLSLILSRNLQRTYRLTEKEVRDVVRLVQRIFNYRFPEKTGSLRILKNPLLAAPERLRKKCPSPLASSFRALGAYLSPGGQAPNVNPSGHCLGNLILTAAIFRSNGGRTDRPAGLGAIRAGLDEVAMLIGVTPGHLHAATSTPGQLKFRYGNGVEVYGQMKSALARRGFPVERLVVEFSDDPSVSVSVVRAIRKADLIIYAPGSLYTSIIPLLQLRPIIGAIRSNRKALKILAANFWIQEGETDISPGNEGRGFLVSDLIDAYNRNVTGGVRDLFHIVLSANLEHMPGDILRNYALEGKMPIHLDRNRVEAMGFQSFEAILFSLEQLEHTPVIHHDAEYFALAIRTLLFAKNAPRGLGKRSPRRQVKEQRSLRRDSGRLSLPHSRRLQRRPLLCEYLASISEELAEKDFHQQSLKSVMIDLAWDNRDILPSHLRFFHGARVVSARDWNRSTEWDNVLGYYDPADRYLKIHKQLIGNPKQLREDLLIALGESLLGNYIESRRWMDNPSAETKEARFYEIRLRPAGKRESFLSDRQLHDYLKLARMVPDETSPLIYRLAINNNEGFLPPGLLFGLMYAWYLNDAYGGLMEYEMSLLRWPPKSLIPHQAKEYIRRQALVTFFRTEIFRHQEK